MSRPTPTQVRDLIAQARKLHRELPSIEARLMAALERDRTGSAIPDGFPSQTMGDGAGGSELTSTESAAYRRSRRVRDPLRENCEQACGYLEAVVMSANALRTRLANIDALGADAALDSPCCTHHRTANLERMWEHYGNVGGRLTSELHLCGACYDFVRNQGRLPSDEEMLHHDGHGKWKVRVTSNAPTATAI